jgi:hypothetical protein
MHELQCTHTDLAWKNLHEEHEAKVRASAQLEQSINWQKKLVPMDKDTMWSLVKEVAEERAAKRMRTSMTGSQNTPEEDAE